MTGQSFPADAFAGTAGYYARYRVPYPESLVKDLVKRSQATDADRLLDLACGPGRLTLPLAPFFREVWAIDLEPEMIEAAKQEAAKQGVKNVDWFLGKAEEFEAPPSSFDQVTIGAAFHRLDQKLVAAKCFSWLKPGGYFAIAGDYGIMDGKEPWQIAVVEVVRRWTALGAPNPGALPPSLALGSPELHERVMKEAGFENVATYPFVHRHEWTIEAIIGYFYSTSFASRRALGGKAPSFEEDLRTALIALEAKGTFREDVRSGYTLGRKPISDDRI